MVGISIDWARNQKSFTEAWSTWPCCGVCIVPLRLPSAATVIFSCIVFDCGGPLVLLYCRTYCCSVLWRHTGPDAFIQTPVNMTAGSASGYALIFCFHLCTQRLHANSSSHAAESALLQNLTLIWKRHFLIQVRLEKCLPLNILEWSKPTVWSVIKHCNFRTIISPECETKKKRIPLQKGHLRRPKKMYAFITGMLMPPALKRSI